MKDRMVALTNRTGQEIGIEVSGEKHYLKEDHTGVPHRRTATEIEQQHLSDEWLHRKE